MDKKREGDTHSKMLAISLRGLRITCTRKRQWIRSAESYMVVQGRWSSSRSSTRNSRLGGAQLGWMADMSVPITRALGNFSATDEKSKIRG